MSELSTPLPQLLDQYGSIISLFATFDDHQWRVMSLCPGWNTRDIAIHIGAIEQMLLGEQPGAVADGDAMQRSIADAAASIASSSDAELYAWLKETLESRAAEIPTYTEDDLAAPSVTPIGMRSYAKFMHIRVFDMWLHEQDVRRPLGLPGSESGPPAELAIDLIEESMPFIAGKLIGLPDGESMRIRLTGPVERTISIAVDGRAALVESLEHPTVELVTDSTTFALLAGGRIDPDVEIAAGHITWTGDDELGARVAHNLNFTP